MISKYPISHGIFKRTPRTDERQRLQSHAYNIVKSDGWAFARELEEEIIEMQENEPKKIKERNYWRDRAYQSEELLRLLFLNQLALEDIRQSDATTSCVADDNEETASFIREQCWKNLTEDLAAEDLEYMRILRLPE
jgi:hypothetical protein